jgi:autotransporter translocation and assembly factor TamB
VVLEKAEVNVASGAIKVTGEADLRQAFSNGFLAPERDLEAISYEALVETADLAIGQLLAGNGDVTGTGSGSFSLKGRGVSPKTLRAETALEISALQVKASAVAEPIAVNLKAEGGLEGGVATLRTLEGEAGGSKIQSNGHFDLSSREVSGKFVVDAPDLSHTLPSFGVREAHGALKIEAHLSGSAERPVFDCALRGDQLRFQEIILGDLRLTGDLDPSGVLRLSELTLSNQGSFIAGTGSVDLFERSFDVKVAGDPILLEDFTDQIKGRLSLKAHLGGSTKEPRGTVELHGTTLDLGVQKVHEMKLHSKLDGEKIWLSLLEVALAPDQVLEANGWLSTDRAFDVAVISKGIALQNIDKLREAGLAEGVMQIDVAAKGTIEDPQIEGKIAFNEVKVMGEAMDDFGLDLKVHDQTAHVSAKLNFDVNGSYHLRTKDFSGTILS